MRKNILVIVALCLTSVNFHIASASTNLATIDCNAVSIPIKECLHKIITHVNALVTENNSLTEEVNQLRSDLAILQNKEAFHEFKIGGDPNYFYPVWFQDLSSCWAAGESRLTIARANVHADGQIKGSMVARFVYHGSGWGHQSDYLEMAINNSPGSAYVYSDFIADISLAYHSLPGLAVWLRGGLTYGYKGNCTQAPKFDVDNDLYIYGDLFFQKTNVIKTTVSNLKNKGWRQVRTTGGPANINDLIWGVIDSIRED
ncbi:MAG: hypothetical protein HQK50_05645 [Oligoflexia bacterium]|nr:hypothetical protein [Oligoflexia bacterium]MBF0365033.1 hypothetical protein [Oligoflexia bacterium]